MAHSITDALEIIQEQISPLDVEILPIEEALHRIVAKEYIAQFHLPRFNNSAMDGYVVKVADARKVVVCKESIYAGDNPQMELQEGTAIKIMTGAPIPKGGEAIVPIEQVTCDGNNITLPEKLTHNHFIRMAGEDIEKGSLFLRKGEKINAYTIAALASQGITHLHVYRTIKVAIFATGDELRPHYEKIEEHQLYNSNSPMFLARSRALGCEVRLVQTSADTLEALESAIRSTLDADIIITSGGVSVGDKDFTKEAFSNLGAQTLINKIDIKPGKPTTISRIQKTIVVNLPGNPLAAMVNYEIFLRAIVRKMSGARAFHHATVTTTLKDDFVTKGGKYSVVLGSFDAQGFSPLRPQMPGMVSPMQHADGLLLLRPEVTHLAKGSQVKMLPILWEFSGEERESLFSQ